MKATKLLTAEHRVIEQALDCLEELSRRCSRTGALDGPTARDTLDFISEFADRCHHGKEEEHLFGFMEAAGLPRDGGPTGVMLIEHDQGRTHVRSMKDLVDAASSGDEVACSAFRSHADEFVGLLKAHINKEDQCLFPMAEQALDEATQEELERLFERVNKDEIGLDVQRRYLKLADELSARLGLQGGRGAEHAALIGDPIKENA